jgi:hypothetical protein
MFNSHVISTPLEAKHRLYKYDYPHSPNEQGQMAFVPYAQAMGSLMHNNVYTKPNTTYIVNSLVQFLSTPSPRHWQGIKCTLHYIKGTTNLSIKYQHQVNGNIFYGFFNVDWASDQNMK